MAKKRIKPEDVAAGALKCRGPRAQNVKALGEALLKLAKGESVPADVIAVDATIRVGALADADPLKAVGRAAAAIKKTGAKTTDAALTALFAAGDMDAARILDHASRTAFCGNDLRADIAADGQFDGEPHDYECSKCGMSHSYRRAAA